MTAPNFLLFVMDDVSKYEFRTYDADPGNNQAPLTEVEELVVPRAVRWSRAYAKPNCSPFRVAAVTGRHSFRTGIGELVNPESVAVSTDEVTIAKVLGAAGYATSFIGKCHMSNQTNGGKLYPALAGWDFYRGTIRNFPARGDEDFYNWTRTTTQKTRRGIESYDEHMSEYATIVEVEDALEWIGRQSRPWYCHFCFNEPHEPLNRPPPELYDTERYVLPYDRPPSGSTVNEMNPYFKAKLQAASWAIGQILRRMEQGVLENTHVIIVGDNGTPQKVTVSPWNPLHAKNTIYEQGINVPLYWMGPGIDLPNRDCACLFAAEDFFPTIAALAGVNLATSYPTLTIDGISQAPHLIDASVRDLRQLLYTEGFSPNGPNSAAATPGERAVVGPTYKLIRKTTGIVFPHASDEMYDVVSDVQETVNLIPGGSTGGLTAEQLSAYNSMVSYFTTTVTS